MSRTLASLILLLIGALARTAQAGEIGNSTRTRAEYRGLFFSYDRLVHRSHLRAAGDLRTRLAELRRRLIPSSAMRVSLEGEVAVAVPHVEAARLVRLSRGFHVAVFSGSRRIETDVLTGFELRSFEGEQPLLFFTTAREHGTDRFYVLARTTTALAKVLGAGQLERASERITARNSGELAAYFARNRGELEVLLNACFCYPDCPCGELVAAIERRGGIEQAFTGLITLESWKTELDGDGDLVYVVQGRGPESWLRFVAVILSGVPEPLVVAHADFDQILHLNGRPHLLIHRFEPGTGSRAVVLLRVGRGELASVFLDDSYSD